ncbi:hypothetical protein D9758_018806 [Tetrapyrgos nigripes]|uniref:Uncharacterized protein n=1 Tax=Tetrapyrgos nigripes TaxID=182062 RepID=A0A8H5FDE6_9AGAR|nr:hypothetical protein D9758_018806 [Tetrapyrgos nigripes]
MILPLDINMLSLASTMFCKNPYKKLAILSGPLNTVLSVSFSIDGTFVSAAGYGGVMIWDLQTGQVVPTPHLPYSPFEKKHVYSSSAWFYFEESDKHVFICRNMAGQVTVWYWDNLLEQMFQMSESQNVYRNVPEQVLSVDVLQGRVPFDKDGFFVMSTDDNSVAVWKLNSALVLSNVFKTNLPSAFIPRFIQASSSVIAFSKASGSLDSVAFDESRDIFAAWMGKDVVVFKLSSAEHITTFRIEGCDAGKMMQVTFAEDGSMLIAGTGYASAEVFSLDLGKRLQSLSYLGGPLVQCNAALTLPSSHLVAIAGSTKWLPAQVIVFTRRRLVNQYTEIVWVVICLMLPVIYICCLHKLVYYTLDISAYIWTSPHSNAIDAPTTYHSLPATSTVTVTEKDFVTVTKRESVTHIIFEAVPVTFTFKLDSDMTQVTSITHSDVEKVEDLNTI